MNNKEFRDRYKSGAVSGGYLLFGDEDYVKSVYVRELCASVVGGVFEEFNVLRLDGTEVTPGQIEEAISSFPMMAERKVVIVSPFLPSAHKREGELDSYISAFSTVADFPQTVLAVVMPSGEEETKKNEYAGATKKLVSVLTPVDFPKRTPAELRRWIAKGAGDNITPEAVDRVLATCGTDSFVLHGEVEKLAAWSGAHGGAQITPDVVRTVCCETKEEGAFDLANAVLDGNIAEALELLKRARVRGDEPIVYAAGISKTICEMHSVRVLLDAGVKPDEIPSILKIADYPCRLRVRAVQGIDADRLLAMVNRCAECDRLLKSSSRGFDAVERLVCTLPARRKNK